jgi:hypothetical protein
MHTPKSRTRRRAEYDTAPYSPIHASHPVSRQQIPSTIAANRCGYRLAVTYDAALDVSDTTRAVFVRLTTSCSVLIDEASTCGLRNRAKFAPGHWLMGV